MRPEAYGRSVETVSRRERIDAARKRFEVALAVAHALDEHVERARKALRDDQIRLDEAERRVDEARDMLRALGVEPGVEP